MTDGNTALDVNLIGLPDLDAGDIEAAAHANRMGTKQSHMPDHAEIADQCRIIQAGWTPHNERVHRQHFAAATPTETPIQVKSARKPSRIRGS